MNKSREMKNVISGDNVSTYIDDTTDGGYWFKVENGAARFVKVTEKALAIFGYASVEELIASGATPHNLVTPIAGGELESEQQYWDFVEGKIDRFSMQCTFRTAKGEDVYGEVFLAKSLVFAGEEGLIRAMIHTVSPTEAIFRQSKQLLDEMNNGIIILRCEQNGIFKLMYGNEGFCDVFKWEQEELKRQYGINVENMIYEEDLDSVMTTLLEAVTSGNTRRNTYRLLNSEGEPVWIKGQHKKVHVGNQELIYINFINITDLMDIQAEMKAANDRLSNFLNSTPAGIIVFEKIDGHYVISAINNTLIFKIQNELERIREEYVYISKEEFIGKDISEMIEFIDPMDRGLSDEFIEQLEKDSSAWFNFKMNLEGANYDQQVWLHCRAIAKKRRNGSYQIIAVFQDISDQIRAKIEINNKQAKIINMSYHDALTDVLNRLSYNEFLKARQAKTLANTGVGFVDINGLKYINDNFGHTKGDDTIRLTVMLMEHYFEKDEIYRLNGDNFVIIAENISQDRFYKKIGKLIGEFNKYEIASMGYNWDDVVHDIKHNIDKAEAAMYIAKQDYYAKHKEDTSKHRPQLLDELLVDLRSGKYVMYLQPKAYTEGVDIVAAEALIRRVEDDGTVTPPVAFVQTLERERLIAPLDYFMLEETCKVLERWNNEGRRKIKISVNMSRVTLAEPNVVNKIVAIVEKYKVSPSQIEFEITESQETMDRHVLEDIVVSISNMGFGVSLDDLGTDYSSVMMLAMKGLDTVKIDRGFIMQMSSEKGCKLVEHLISMCHDLGEICVAEGVEDHEIREKLNQMGCDMYQGFLLSKPVSVEEFEGLIQLEATA